jgi:uncharacterized membrane protein
MVELAVLTAIVLILQIFGIGLRLPFLQTPVSLVLIPIVLGAMLLGPSAGAWLGLIFGIVTLVGGISGTDGFTAILFNEHPVITSLLCLGKGIAAGFIPGIVYKAFSKKKPILSTFIASLLAPIVNTGIFILGSFTMAGTFEANFLNGTSLIYFLVIMCAGVNFIVEFAINLIFAPAIHRLVLVLEKRKF